MSRQHGRTVHVTLRLAPELVEAIDARKVGSRAAWIDQAARAFMAHDEGSAAELAAVVRRYRLAAGLGGADLQRLDADAARVLGDYRRRAQI